MDSSSNLRECANLSKTEESLENYQSSVRQKINLICEILQQAFIGNYNVQVPAVEQLADFHVLGVLVNSLINSVKNSINQLVRSNTELQSEIIERLKIEEALRESTSLMRSILDASNYTVVSTDLDGNIRTFNPGAERMFGFSSSEMIGQSIMTLFGISTEIKRRAEELSQDLGQPILAGFHVLTTKPYLGLPYEQEWTMIRKDGGHFPGLLSLTAIRSEAGAVNGLVGICIDLTERKKVEQMKDEFISIVSHELRTPLTSIRGSLGLIAGNAAASLPDPFKMLLNIAVNNCERLIRLVNNILNIEKIESGKMRLMLKPTEIMPVIEQTIDENASLFDQRKVWVTLRERADGTCVNVDVDAVIRVMTNLLSNAAKFSPFDGEVIIDVSRQKDTVRVSVADEGPGIPQEFRKRIFQKFAQADSSDARRKVGTGLGLSIVKAIVEQLGGKVDFKSEEGKGTAFFFELPTCES